MSSSLDIRNFTRRPAPGFAYAKIAAEVLPGWDISLVFAGTIRAQKINMQLRKKTYIPNVLSYESGKRSGEIIICPAIARIQCGSYGLSYEHFIVFLFIHGLLHLKGLPHGARMERYETQYLQRYTGAVLDYDSKLTDHGTTHRNRN